MHTKTKKHNPPKQPLPTRRGGGVEKKALPSSRKKKGSEGADHRGEDERISSFYRPPRRITSKRGDRRGNRRRGWIPTYLRRDEAEGGSEFVEGKEEYRSVLGARGSAEGKNGLGKGSRRHRGELRIR